VSCVSLEQFPPDTPEQALITGYKGSRLKVQARAGSGKTTTLVKYALRNPNERMLYLAFNRAIRDEALLKFPANVDCKTSHQIAFSAIGRQYAHKLKNNLRLTDIAEALPTPNWTLARDILEALNTFMASADPRILDVHFSRSDRVQGKTRNRVMYQAQVLDGAQMIWHRMTNLEDPFPIIHDAYLKLYQLSLPNLSRKYTVILFDEAQDSNPVTNHIVLQQRCKIIYVGDTHQQIYRFRGASNALEDPLLDGADTLYLTHSFRFGPQVAMVANALLMLKQETKPVVGRGGQDQVLTSLPPECSRFTVLARTVIGVISAAMISALEGKTIYWVGGIEAYQLAELEDLYWFSLRKYDHIRNQKLIKDYGGIDDYEEIAKATKDPEMLRALWLLKNHDNIPALIALIRKMTVAEESAADITVSTAHRCKGLEWPTVALWDDFPDVFDPELSPEAKQDEINLLYVAATRARKALAINPAIGLILRYAKGLAAKKRTTPAN
jgi:superfamily I DNA/RNA helicase